MRQKPGALACLGPGELTGISFATHQLPLRVMLDYLERSAPLVAVIVGIQPQRLDFGELMSKVVARSARRLASILAEIIPGRAVAR